MDTAGSEKITRIERDWKAMIQIAHDFFHSWRRVVAEKYGEADMEELTLRFWELVGQNTAAQYRSRKNFDPQNVEQIVRSMARSSEIMGETVRVERDEETWLLIHDACPWVETYRLVGYLGRCQQGCDQWFRATLERLAADSIVVEIISSMAKGDSNCTRRFYKKSRGD